MSEENNWKVYRAELHETMSKGACVPFLGQFLTQILHQETAKELMSYQSRSKVHRPQSSDLSVDNQEILSALTTPLGSVYNDMNIISEAVFPADLSLYYDEQQTPISSKMLIEKTKNKDAELKYEVYQDEEEGVNKESSSVSLMERKDTLSPLPIGKFKYHHLPPTNAYTESFKKSPPSSDLMVPNNNSTGQQNEGDKSFENGDIAGNNVVCEVVKTLSLELLDSYDGASSSYSCHSMSPRDAPNVPDSEAEDIVYNNDILDISHVELNIDDTLDTPVSDFDKETSPDIIPTTSTPTEDIITVFTDTNTDNEVDETLTNTNVKQSTKGGKKKRRWNSFRRRSLPPKETSQSSNNCSNDVPCKKEKWNMFRRKSAPPEDINHSANNCSDNAPHRKERWSRFRRKSAPPEVTSQSTNNCSDDGSCKKETSKLRQKLSSPLRRISSSGCKGNNVQKKGKGIFRRKSSPAKPSYKDDDAPRKKEKHSLRRILSYPLRGHSNPECNNDTVQRREKFHICKHPNVDGFDAHNMLQEMQFSPMRSMNSLNRRPDIQSFIKGLNYNTEEDNYHISIKMEPHKQYNY